MHAFGGFERAIQILHFSFFTHGLKRNPMKESCFITMTSNLQQINKDLQFVLKKIKCHKNCTILGFQSMNILKTNNTKKQENIFNHLATTWVGNKIIER
jgi:hypothetical protein